MKKFEIENKNIIFFIMCSCVFVQNMIIGGANNANLTTIEQEFYMSSLDLAEFLSSYDIGSIIA